METSSNTPSLGDFKIKKKLGEGGFSKVYLAKDSYGKKVAIKIIKNIT